MGLAANTPSFRLSDLVEQSSAGKAVGAHNPEVRRSKLRSANLKEIKLFFHKYLMDNSSWI